MLVPSVLCDPSEVLVKCEYKNLITDGVYTDTSIGMPHKVRKTQ